MNFANLRYTFGLTAHKTLIQFLFPNYAYTLYIMEFKEAAIEKVFGMSKAVNKHLTSHVYLIRTFPPSKYYKRFIS